MVKIEKDNFFDELVEKYLFLEDFRLGKFYSSIILNYNTEPPHNDFCVKNLEKASDPNCDLSTVCTSVETLLLRLSDIMLKQNISNLSKVCEYLNYWIYYIIKDSLQCIYNINSLYYVLDRLKLLYIPRRHSCDIHDFIIDKEEFLTKKTLFFHSEILHWIKNEYTVINNSNRAEYNQYLNESYNIYKEIICKDDSTLKENCSKELTKFREIFNEAIASLKGKNISINQADIPLENNTLCTTISPRNETVPELPVGLEAQEGPGESDISVLLDAAGYAPSTDRVTMDQGINVITPEDVRPNKASTITGSLAGSLAGSCFFLGMLYKFTPVGSWINNKILGENKPMDNMKRNRNELLLNDIGNREMTLNDTMYHIRYNSAANS